MNERKAHWENVFTTKDTAAVSWFQAYPATSVAFLDYFDLPASANVIDIGAGDSRLVDVFVDRGFAGIYALDISARALEKTRQRLGERASRVHWIVSDVLDFRAPVPIDFWHDRAAFHFLTDDALVRQYVEIAAAAIRPGGFMVLGTFSEQGPDRCSGLHVRQYSEVSMSSVFDPYFERVRCVTEAHETPGHAVQEFVFCSFRRRG
jgi:SAM-dependent methyltransferase